jgi:MFS family permease
MIEFPMNELDPLAARHAARNFWFGVANGALFAVAETLLDPATVLAAFVRLLGGSPWLIGLLFPIRDGLWFLPQLWVSSFIQSWPRKLPLYNLMALLRALVWALLAALVWLVRDRWTLLVGFFALYFLLRLGAGFSGLSFMDVVAKTVPARRRGQYFAWRMLSGGLLSIGVGALVAQLLAPASPLGFPDNFGALFVLAAVIGTIGMALFSLVIEPPEAPQPAVSLGSQLRRAAGLVRRERNYRTFLALRVVLLFAQAALVFFEGFAGEAAGLPPAVIGVYLTASTVAGIVANPVWGRLSERYGYRLVLRAATLAGGLGVALVPLTAWLHLSAGLPAGAAVALFALAFALARVHVAGADVAAGPLLLELAPAGERALYIGATNTLLGIALLTTGLSGGLVETAGYGALFAASVLGFALAGLLAWRVQEPHAELIVITAGQTGVAVNGKPTPAPPEPVVVQPVPPARPAVPQPESPQPESPQPDAPTVDQPPAST